MAFLVRVRAKPTVIPLTKSLKFILEDFESSIDSEYFKEFRLISPEENIYNCEIGKEVREFYIDVIINQLNMKRELYRMNNMKGCIFLADTLLNRVFHGFYENLLVNRTQSIKCPLRRGSYLIRNAINKAALPQFHPKGNFSLILRLKANTMDWIMLELTWLYRLAKA
ncbi:uncharacterized protein LOC133325058 [Musca vetustissima]|uniref:uncharacterized protein LOC133325058 n=1 Tax=Musca vetustissima TaxID=27455 RepID=UPI002AB7757A|nr:uncharacterized protein LOC133325058 [Musca vetustissima]